MRLERWACRKWDLRKSWSARLITRAFTMVAADQGLAGR
jgi:hypothetical protein